MSASWPMKPETPVIMSFMIVGENQGEKKRSEIRGRWYFSRLSRCGVIAVKVKKSRLAPKI